MQTKSERSSDAGHSPNETANPWYMIAIPAAKGAGQLGEARAFDIGARD
jgi:hypothetical protein